MLDTAPGVVGVAAHELPALPDGIGSNPELGRHDPRAWFARAGAALEIEIGTGKGAFILMHAANNPGVNILGIEREGEIWAYAADRVRRRGLTNVRMLHGDAVDFLRWRCPSGIVRVLHLYYSDPWPKAKHHKNRVVQHRFLAEAWRVLEPGGELRVVTDHDELWAWCRERFAVWTEGGAYLAWHAGGRADLERSVPGEACPSPSAGAPFRLGAFEAPGWADEGEVVGTNYEKKFCGGGKKPHSCVLVKAGGGGDSGGGGV